MSTVRVIAGACVALAFTLWASSFVAPERAFASTPGPASRVAAPIPDPSGALALAEETIDIVCIGVEGHLQLRCDANARYVYRVIAAGASLVLPPVDDGVVRTIRVDNRSVRQEHDTPEAPIALAAAPGQTVVVEVHHAVDVIGLDDSPYLTPALSTRHPVLAEATVADSLPRFIVLASDAARFTQAAPARIHVHAVGWTLALGTWVTSDDNEVGPIRTYEDEGSTDDDAAISLVVEPGERGLAVTLQRRHAPLYQGGPFLGIGGDIDDGFRMRLGWEVGFHPVLLGSLSVETNFDDEVVAAALLEAALPTLLIIPSLGVGVGVPVRVAPDVSAGLRIQLTASYYVSFVTSFDWFPADDGAPWRIALYGQIGL